MREWLNRAASKAVVQLVCTEGSNPSLSEAMEIEREIRQMLFLLWRDDRVAEGARLESVCTLTGYRGFESLSLRTP